MIGSLFNKVQLLLTNNSTTILTGIGVVGTVSTGFLAARGGMKASKLLAAADVELVYEKGQDPPTLSNWQKFQIVAPEFIPAVGVGGVTIAAIIFSHRLSAKETAAIAAAYGMSEKKFEEYRTKVQEKLGQKEQDLSDEIAQDRIDRNPVDDRSVIITGSGEVLCYDVLTDRYFNASVETIKKAENEVNAQILNHDEVSLSSFYEEIGLQPTPYSDTVGWNLEHRCEVDITATMSKDQRPCISVDFKRWPKPDYDAVYHP